MNEVSESALPPYLLVSAENAHVTGVSVPAPVVLRPLEIVASKVEIIAGDENRTRRAGSDYGIYLCAIHARAICQTTPYSQTKDVR